ncbi:MAG: glycosyltransferase [Acidobacteriaceae bacterium]
MKILHVIPSLSPASGGPAEALRQLVRAYPEVGVEAEIACLDASDADWIGNFAAQVHAMDWHGGKYGFSLRLRDWLAGNVARFDGVVAHAIWSYPALAAARAARGHVPYAVFTHGMLDPWFQRRYPPKHLKKRLYWPIQYPVLRDAKSVLFTSRIESELAPQSFRPNKWTSLVVPYGTNGPPPDEEAQRRAFLSKLPQLAGRRFLLFLSRIHEKKGCDLLVEAFAAIAPLYQNVDLVIAGPDQTGLQSQLMASAERLGIVGRIHWPGLLTGDAKWGAIRASEAMVLPSHQENFGVVVAEALACGRPALISNQVNLWPQIEEDRCGLIEPDTLEGTRSLLTRWFALSEAEKSAMGERAFATFHARYSMRNCALAIRDLFSSGNGQASA